MPPLTQNQTNAIDNANITASNLENPTPTPNLPTGSTFDINQYTTPSYSQNQDLAMAKQNSDTSLNDLTTAMFGSENQGSRLLGMENSAGIPDLQNQLTDITNQINTTDLNFRRERENIQNDQTLSMAQKNSRLRDVSFKQASNLADMEVIRSARSNTLSNLQAQVQRKADLQFADEKTRIDNLKFIYDNNEGKYKDQLGEVIKKEDRAYDLAKTKYTNTEQQKADLVKTSAQNGASNDILQGIMKSTTLDEAYGLAKNFLENPLDRAIKQAQLTKLNLDNQGGSVGGKIVKINGVDYMQDANGNLTIPKVPQSSGGSDVEKQTIQNKLTTLDSLIGGKGQAGAVGASPLARNKVARLLTGGIAGAGSKANFIASVEQITKGLTLQQLIDAKANGATFGALSDSELSLLAGSASKIGTWAIKDKQGNITGYKANEKDFNNELNVIKLLTQKAYDQKYGTQDINNYLDSVNTALQNNTTLYSQAGYNLQ
jgi:hypothetical protein